MAAESPTSYPDNLTASNNRGAEKHRRRGSEGALGLYEFNFSIHFIPIVPGFKRQSGTKTKEESRG